MLGGIQAGNGSRMTLDRQLTRDSLAAVDAGFERQTAFTEELIRFPSLRGQEHTAQDFLFNELKSRGFAMDRWAINVADIENHPGFSPVKVDYSLSLIHI
jgi:acetylornithine deacetylase